MKVRPPYQNLPRLSARKCLRLSALRLDRLPPRRPPIEERAHAGGGSTQGLYPL